jgi:hypothetical protein
MRTLSDVPATADGRSALSGKFRPQGGPAGTAWQARRSLSLSDWGLIEAAMMVCQGRCWPGTDSVGESAAEVRELELAEPRAQQ